MITIKATSLMSRPELIAALEQANAGARAQAEAMTELGKLTDMQMKRIAALEAEVQRLQRHVEHQQGILTGRDHPLIQQLETEVSSLRRQVARVLPHPKRSRKL